MNFLAHFFLSGDDVHTQIGGFIADHVKGPIPSDLPDGIRKGIWLHRKVDAFTDGHPLVRQATRLIDPEWGLYRGIIIDIYFDHILALHFDRYAQVSLDDFAETVFSGVEANFDYLPEPARSYAPHMIRKNWLSGYREVENIRRALSRFRRRGNAGKDLADVLPQLQDRHSNLEDLFLEFMPELIEHVKINEADWDEGRIAV